jgi:hypothetical protein
MAGTIFRISQSLEKVVLSGEPIIWFSDLFGMLFRFRHSEASACVAPLNTIAALCHAKETQKLFVGCD